MVCNMVYRRHALGTKAPSYISLLSRQLPMILSCQRHNYNSECTELCWRNRTLMVLVYVKVLQINAILL